MENKELSDVVVNAMKALTNQKLAAINPDYPTGLVNEMKNYYNPKTDKKPYLKDFKKHLLNIYDLDFEAAHAYDIANHNFLKRAGYIAGSTAVVGGSLLALAVSPALGGIVFGGLSLYVASIIKDSRKTSKELKASKKLFEKDEEIKKSIESMSLDQLDFILQENKQQIEQYLYPVKH